MKIALRRTSKGQTTAETMVMLPLILATLFMVLQVGMIGLGFIYAYYGASSVGRAASRTSGGTNVDAETLKPILVAGLKARDVKTSPTPGSQNSLKVSACVEVVGVPLINQIIGPAFPRYSGCAPDGRAGLYYEDGATPKFIVKGMCLSRKN